MQDREPTSAASIWPTDLAGGHAPGQPADLWDVSNENHDAALLLREPFADRVGTLVLAATALAASFVLGWAGSQYWHEFAGTSGPSQVVAQKEAPPPPRVAETRTRSEGARRSASNSEPAVTGSIPKATANPRPLTMGAAPTTLNAQAAALSTKPQLATAPETRPGTVPGWSVLEVRDGTAVLEGPDGVKMVARGDVVPGLGRVDSIVRWGNRWIVATANGLVATP
ncbi:hypothetical protein JQ633_26550 [Bradyrhizobium tropiciagri]|uniref:hypothetical protein n=1 Tax=Bradyrhizobium tropiciagri TaxID=312253 RepID=UPI001BABBE1A|nr:hypothetical protein [Bradyrhizobium tropiciagri]MBR0873947.1 hypothetical protein [Bradyrhizobium tropiciagri]